MRPLPPALLLCCFAIPAHAVDEFVPYPDGRAGGCYRSPKGQLYGCTAVPVNEARSGADEPEPSRAAAATAEVATREEVAALRAELELLKRQQAEDDARRARARARRADAERAEQAAEQAEIDAAMAAYLAIEAAKDSERLRALERETERCRQALRRKGYQVVGPGACKAPDGSYVNCPAC